MSRTIPDLHFRKIRYPQNPWGTNNQLPREPRFSTNRSRDTDAENKHASKINRSGEVFVSQGENNRLLFRATTSHGIGSDRIPCGLQRVKDGTRVHLHLCWQFCDSDFHSKEMKDLLIALDRVVRILKELDCCQVGQSQPKDLGPKSNGYASVADIDSILSLGRKNFAPECPAKTPAPFTSTRLLDALYSSGDLSTPEKTRECSCDHTHSPSVDTSKREMRFENIEYANPPGNVSDGEDIPDSETTERQDHCTTASERKRKCEFEPDIAHDRRISENGNKVRDNLLGQRRLRDFLRERELKKKARESVIASARKTAVEAAKKYGEDKLHDCPQRDAFRLDQFTGRGLNSPFDAGRPPYDVGREICRENLQSFDLHRQKHSSKTLVDKTVAFGTESPSPDLIGCSYDSDVEIVSRTSLHGGGGSVTEENRVHSMRRKEFGSGRGDDLQKSGQYASENGKRRKKVSFRDRKSFKPNDSPPSVDYPEVDEVFRSSNWKSVDEGEQVRTILEQFHRLELYFRSKNDAGSGGLERRGSVRPDLKAGNYLLSRGYCFNKGYVVGKIPGVSIGQCFRYREELILLSIHRAQQAGIDYIPASKSAYRDANGNPAAVAISIVASGGYTNQDDGETTLIYSGQGGYSNKTQGNHRVKTVQDHDQELVRGNLALVNSLQLQVPVRVTRGIQAKDQRKLYVYDGLYDVKDCYEETGLSGFKVWKFKLVKQADEPVTTVTKYKSPDETYRALLSAAHWATKRGSRSIVDRGERLSDLVNPGIHSSSMLCTMPYQPLTLLNSSLDEYNPSVLEAGRGGL